MKYVFTIFILFPVFSFAQECNVKSIRDPYTHEVKITTGLISLNSGQYSIEATKTQIDFMFTLEGKCFDDASTAAVFFEGTRLKSNFRNSGTMNCNGIFHFMFRNTNPSATALQNLGNKRISSIRFKDNTNKETSVSLTEDQQQKLMNLINCMINESKKLSQ